MWPSTATVDLGVPDVQLDYRVAHEGDRTPGSYAGFDRFGRVIHHPWVDGGFTTHATSGTVPNIPPIVELEYTLRQGGRGSRAGTPTPPNA